MLTRSVNLPETVLMNGEGTVSSKPGSLCHSTSGLPTTLYKGSEKSFLGGHLPSRFLGPSLRVGSEDTWRPPQTASGAARSPRPAQRCPARARGMTPTWRVHAPAATSSPAEANSTVNVGTTCFLPNGPARYLSTHT